MKIEYSDTGAKGLDLVKLLWEKLNSYEKERSPRFGYYFLARSFAERKSEILETSKSGALRVDLAKDSDTVEVIGYCVSTINKDKQGRIESIYIEPDYRRHGIGQKLIQRAVLWMDENKVLRKTLVVVAGNEEVFSFYSHHNFYPLVTVLEQKESK